LSRFLLDTNVISETRRVRPHGALLSWLKSVDAEDLAVPAVAVAELQFGAELTRLQDQAKAAELDSWIDQIVSTHQVIAMDAACFREFARLIQGHSDTLREDAMIAATARIHGMTIATRNERDFQSFAVPVFNPFRGN